MAERGGYIIVDDDGNMAQFTLPDFCPCCGGDDIDIGYLGGIPVDISKFIWVCTECMHQWPTRGKGA